MAGEDWRKAHEERLVSLGLREAPPLPRRPGPKLVPIIALVAVLGLVLWGAVSCFSAEPKAPMTKAQEYPGPWVSPTPEVYRAMYAAGFRCGEVYARSSVKSNGETLVYCFDHQRMSFTSYLVWLPSGRALGPDHDFPLTSGIPLPERSEGNVSLDTAS